MTIDKHSALEALYQPHHDFKHSPLYVEGGCTNIVFGEGDPDASLLFIGEAPGEQEDLQKRPFVGRSGQLLNRALQLANIKREAVYITNIVKCRPPNNRTPSPTELKTGRDTLLLKQIEIINPQVICTLGSAALTGLTERPYQISKIRGQPLDFHGHILFPTYHPAYVLRNPAATDQFFADIKTAVLLSKKSGG